MAISISELYGKKLITTDGMELGEVKAVIVDTEEGTVSHFVLIDFETLKRSHDIREVLKKKSVLFKRVKKIGETIIVGREEQ